MKKMKILVLDNYDSFTFNLVHILKELSEGPVDVYRNDEISLDEIGRYDKIVIPTRRRTQSRRRYLYDS